MHGRNEPRQQIWGDRVDHPETQCADQGVLAARCDILQPAGFLQNAFGLASDLDARRRQPDARRRPFEQHDSVSLLEFS